MRYLLLLVFLSFVALLAAPLTGCGTTSVSGESSKEGSLARATVSRVVDGDTVEIRPRVDGEEDVRLIGIDTPEKAYSSREAQPYALEASRFTREKLEGQKVALRFGAEKKDRYGRVLAYLYLPDGSMFNEALVDKGYAQVATFPPNVRYVERFEQAQRKAREAGIGIWSLPKSKLCRLTDRGNGIGGGC